MSDALLLSMWTNINEEHFGGALKPLAEIGWLPLSDAEEGIDAFGIYFPRSNAIAIDERFRPDEGKASSGDATELAKIEVTYRLVVHEMIHQAAHQQQLPWPGSHGDSFIAVATPVAISLKTAPPTAATADRWPDLLPLLAHFRL